MVNGMFVSPERVVRNGFLVAYEGEVMGFDEAARRGLATGTEPEPESKGAAARKGRAARKGGGSRKSR